MADERQSTVILDDFNYVESPISNGGKWANPDTAWNTLYTDGISARALAAIYSNMYWTPLVLSGDDAECWGFAVGGNAVGQAWGIHLYTTTSIPGNGTSDGYFWRNEVSSGGGTSRLYRLTNNSGTVIDSDAASPPSGGQFIMMIRRVNTGAGQTIEGWATADPTGVTGWTMFVSAADATYQGDMYAGMSLSGSLTEWDYFGAGVGQANRTQIYRIIKGFTATTESS